ncbi:D-isomer specific 2-hydroxyacid dehydrogenase [Cellvibrio sp. BR]|jgi:D-3-phosphoglycerate dehydrogenase|uniref:phosphoglycerate dehydrogenase n=1 Tax=unclassified Cellvibrio TaxID=2624793 RepID=UPI0002600F68|nr:MULTISPECIES: phosphoglycerate dehydrogenase [unclassified Cellvibrio]EIK43855.1 D-isomer specific 2-hydroxyacid dehydrogenase [Cellvibrio sp. BR]QEY13661.1 3-phosphoglycerate dehydrogenase [Cellvibrio sp. KY-YJ-3]UUA72929.1 phosphoglycerate dehydrogenase [Cellvibrio sp. QJXJ]
MFKIKTYNAISVKGLNRFPRENYEVASDIGHPDAYILRSHKLQGEPLPESVKAVARAGAGTNNVPVEEYTKKGVVVFNSPGANANAVKELVLAGMLLGSRGILPGMEYVSTLTHMTDADEMSKLLEKEKSNFAGFELAGKTLGIVGLGAIGSLIADAALALGMNVVGFDPALSVEAAWRLPSQVGRMENLQSLLARSDYITLHVPAIPQTKHLINADTLKVTKKGATLLNFAREAIVDAHAVVESLDAGHLGKYICDFPEPILLNRKDVYAMPHIGASTEEAEENCAIMAADQLVDYLENGNIKNSVNFPAVSMDRNPGIGARITFSNQNVSGVLGHVLSVLADHKVNVVDMVNKSRGDVAYNIIDVEAAPSAAVIDALAKVEHVIAVRVI